MPDNERPAANEIICIARIGNTQALMELRGDSHWKRPVVKFAKIVTAEDLKNDPDRTKYYEIEELAAIQELCKRLINEAYGLQMLVPQT